MNWPFNSTQPSWGTKRHFSMKNSTEGFQSTWHTVTLTVWWLVWWSELKPSLESSKELKLIPRSRALQRTLGNTSISSTQVAQTYTHTHTVWWSDQPCWLPPHTLPTFRKWHHLYMTAPTPANLSITFTLLSFPPPIQAFRGPETAV